MSVQEERELRERLGGLLDKVEPRPAPVLRAMHQGRGIRMRRWVSAAAGIAVLAVGAVALPIALRGQGTPSPAGPLHYSVTVNPPGKHAPHGLISSGTQDGHRWRVVLSGRGQKMSVRSSSGAEGASGALPSDSTPVNFQEWGDDSPGGSNSILGAVRKDVTRVAIIMPGGKVLTLTPVRYDGQRYVGVVIPSRVPIVRAVAYHGGQELAYSIPYQGVGLDNWWLPGQVGPSRLTKVISSGVTEGHVWRYTADIGPWGYCFNLSDGSGDCLSGLHPQTLQPGSGTVQQMACGPLAVAGADGPWTGMASAGSDVQTVVLTLSDGTIEHISTANVGGARLFGYGVGKGLKIVATKEFSASGQVVGTTPASALNCP